MSRLKMMERSLRRREINQSTFVDAEQRKLPGNTLSPFVTQTKGFLLPLIPNSWLQNQLLCERRHRKHDGGWGGGGKSAILLSEVRNDDSAVQLFGKPATVANNLLYQNFTAAVNTAVCKQA